MSDIESVDEKTAFYRQNGIINGKMHNPDYPFREVYDEVFEIVKSKLLNGMETRALCTTLICVALDGISMAMGTAEYTEDATKEMDMQAFMEMLMGMINNMENATNTNVNLAVGDKSIYNKEERTLDS